MIEVRHLYKSFGDKEVLKDINFKFEDGKTNLIIGQSGSGKTVLMKNLVGLLDPTSGEVLYDGRDFVKMTKQEKVAMRREMGMIFQSAALFDSLSVLENVMFPLDMFSNMNYREKLKRAQECIDRVNLIKIMAGLLVTLFVLCIGMAIQIGHYKINNNKLTKQFEEINDELLEAKTSLACADTYISEMESSLGILRDDAKGFQSVIDELDEQK